MWIILAIFTGIAISIQDLRTQRISIWLLGVFALLSLGNWMGGGGVITTHSMTGVFLMIPLILLIAFYEKIRGIHLLGSGDKILLFCCCGWLGSQQLPCFLILAGILGCMTTLIYKVIYAQSTNHPVPFAPAILVSIPLTTVLEPSGFGLFHWL